MSEYREFWIIDHGGMHDSYSVSLNKPGFSGIWTKENIHVIEFSVYEKQVELIAKLKEALICINEDIEMDVAHHCTQVKEALALLKSEGL